MGFRVGVLDAFLSTWSQARAAFGNGVPRGGGQFDAHAVLTRLRDRTEDAAPGSRWTGTAASAYGTVNAELGRVIGQLAVLDRRLRRDVDRSAQTVTAGRRDLDAVRTWVVDAAAAIPPAVRGGGMLLPIVSRGLRDVDDIVRRSHGEFTALGEGLRTLGALYDALGAQTFGVGMGDAPATFGPTLTTTQRADRANRETLAAERTRTRAGLTRIQAGVDDLVRQQYMGDTSADTANRLAVLIPQREAALARLAEFDAVGQALAGAPLTYLAQLTVPWDHSGKVLAAVAVGNPDTARNVSVTVPGVSSTTRDSLPTMVAEAHALQLESMRQLQNAGQSPSVATIAWMGYEPPPNPLDTLSPRDAVATIDDDQAQAGAVHLGAYLAQIDADNPTAHVTLLGHSYGSLTASLALQHLDDAGLRPVHDAVFYGSPGLGLEHASELGLDGGTAYVMAAPGDPITMLFAPLAPEYGWGIDPYDPRAGFTPLGTLPGYDPDGIWREGSIGHSEYSRSSTGDDGRTQLRMSGYHLAAIAAGLPDNAVQSPYLRGGG